MGFRLARMDLVWDFALRLFLAGVMGILIGLEREYRAKEAGYRTHFLVALVGRIFWWHWEVH